MPPDRNGGTGNPAGLLWLNSQGQEVCFNGTGSIEVTIYGVSHIHLGSHRVSFEVEATPGAARTQFPSGGATLYPGGGALRINPPIHAIKRINILS